MARGEWQAQLCGSVDLGSNHPTEPTRHPPLTRSHVHARYLAALFAVALAMACASAPPDDDADADKLLAVVVRSMGTTEDTATFEVSLANVSSLTLKILGVTVNPGLPREMYGVPSASQFTLEPGMERSVIAEMRSNRDMRSVRGGRPDWPDQVAVDVSMERNGKSDSRTYRVWVQPVR